MIHTHSLTESSQQLYNIYATTISILQMRKQDPVMLSSLPKVTELAVAESGFKYRSTYCRVC